jgi:uncharacterized membrane protein YcaP (DUF421 family)
MQMEFHWSDILIRTMLAFILLLLATRILGKQMRSKMTHANFVTNITLGSLTGAIILDHNITLGDLLLAIAAFTAVAFLASMFSLWNHRTRRVLTGRPIELVRDGKILEQEMKHSRIAMDNLVQQLRLRGVFDISHVQLAMMEPNGEVSVLMKPEHRDLKFGELMQLLQKQVPQEKMPVELIIDGGVLTENLHKAKLDLAWLMQELDKHGANDVTEVAYAVLTSKDKLYIDKYSDEF